MAERAADMSSNKTILIVSVILYAHCFLAGCAASRHETQEQHHVRPGYVHHVVICWLKDAGNEEQRERLIHASRGFYGIPGIVDLSAGEVLPGERSMVDSSFDVAIVMTFRNKQDMKRYLSHPDHEKARDEILVPLTERVVVYDIIE